MRLALSESKMQIGLEEIDLLGLHIKNENIIFQAYIAESIVKFSDQLTGRKQIQ